MSVSDELIRSDEQWPEKKFMKLGNRLIQLVIIQTIFFQSWKPGSFWRSHDSGLLSNWMSWEPFYVVFPSCFFLLIHHVMVTLLSPPFFLSISHSLSLYGFLSFPSSLILSLTHSGKWQFVAVYQRNPNQAQKQKPLLINIAWFWTTPLTENSCRLVSHGWISDLPVYTTEIDAMIFYLMGPSTELFDRLMQNVFL